MEPGTLRILAVDDHQDHLEMLSLSLEVAGFEVRTAGDREAVERVLASGFVPDVFVVDHLLAGGARGEDLVARLRAVPAYGRACWIALTGATGYLEALRSGGLFDAVLVKPASVDALVDAVRACARPPAA